MKPVKDYVKLYQERRGAFEKKVQYMVQVN